MKKTGRILSRLICLTLMLALSYHWGGMNNTAKGEEMNSQKIATTLLISFVIGNAVAWSMGAYPRDYAVKPYSEEDLTIINELKEEIRNHPDEADIKTDLGALYFTHNDLDKAEEVLGQAKQEDSSNAEALVVWSANEAKQAGAMWDLTWGIWKLNRLENAVNGLEQAVRLDPESLNVRMYRAHTILGIKRESWFFHILEDEQWFLNHLETDRDYFPEDVKQQFYSIFSHAYLYRLDFSGDENARSESLGKLELYVQKLTKGSSEKEVLTRKLAQLNNELTH
ncbi:MAG: hypothetical protein HN580_25430 [Deltaproteobacteria bacterium]|nr:hypothetical protein [Deltaproteobacteria bacterium]MBT4269588.1 hypothetical protein [Deltaproteobacteria bacterium]MBT4637810.1 hypothetical protein [Deltaproteobacteria bacterium]MBT6499352.1 hypothetical protein [Deltaproteobacteria bacterium]MBT7150837.1 hypothetical protein [Deltaproteobacteria bacterium]